MATWHLEDVTAAAAANPMSFFVPSPTERENRVPRELVRLHFVLDERAADAPRAERMWVEVSERIESAGMVSYRGALTNKPAWIRGLSPGDVVEFEPKHIAQVLVGPDDPNWLEIGERRAAVSACALEEGRRIRFAYRQSPARDDDSGWSMLAGDETQEYTDDAKNIRLCNVYWLVERDPSLMAILRAEVGTVFELLDDEWVPVEDWAPEDDE